MSRLPASNRWAVGDYTFTEHTEHPFTDEYAGPMYKFWIGEKEGCELYGSLDHAMAAAIAEKHTGRPGPTGGTAANWFMRMIGADQ